LTGIQQRGDSSSSRSGGTFGQGETRRRREARASTSTGNVHRDGGPSVVGTRLSKTRVGSRPPGRTRQQIPPPARFCPAGLQRWLPRCAGRSVDECECEPSAAPGGRAGRCSFHPRSKCCRAETTFGRAGRGQFVGRRRNLVRRRLIRIRRRRRPLFDSSSSLNASRGVRCVAERRWWQGSASRPRREGRCRDEQLEGEGSRVLDLRVVDASGRAWLPHR